MLEDEKTKNLEIQNKLDKKSKELHDMNEYTKKLLSNKDNLLSQFEEKIDKITKDKNDLISQNKELLEKMKSKSEQSQINIGGTSLADIITEEEAKNNNEDLIQYKKENKILNDEIENLKEQLSIQEKDLLNLNSLQIEIVKLKGQNEILIKNNKEISQKLEDQRKKEEQELMKKKKNELVKAIKSLKRKQILDGDNNFDKEHYEKQIEALKKLKNDEKNDYEEQIKKLRMEMAVIKIRNIQQQNKNDELLNNYRNAIKLLTSQNFKKYGIIYICFIILIIAIKMII